MSFRKSPAPSTRCRKRLHEFTEENIYIGNDGRRRCRECITINKAALNLRLRKHAEPHETGLCRAGLHEWVEANWWVSKHGQVVCSPCQRERKRELYRRKGLTYCVVARCRAQSLQRDPPFSYICPTHRQNPPEWIANRIRRGELRIVGTEVLAA